MNEIPTTVKNRHLVEKRREQIVHSAIKLFARKGFHKTTLRELSEEAHISYGNIYDYIGCKDDIFYLIHEHLCDQVFEELEKAVNNIDDPLEKLRRMVRAEFSFMDRWSDGILLLYQEGHVLKSPYLQKFLKKEHEHILMFEKVINECVQQGFLRECNPRLAANLIKMIIDGWILKRWDLRGCATSQETEKFILELVLLGLLPDSIEGNRSPAGEMNTLSGKKALVVGAESLLGAAVCSALSSAGARVCAVFDDSTFSGSNANRTDFSVKGVTFYPTSRYGRLTPALFERIEQDFGTIDAYVHDVGTGVVVQGPEQPDRASLLTSNLQSAQEIARGILKNMSRNPWGRLVYIAPWAWDVHADALAYHSAVAATLSLSSSLSKALASNRINVNCVIPGHIKIPLSSEWKKSSYGKLQESFPPGGLGEISDVSNAVLFFLGENARYLTNQVLRVAFNQNQ